MIYDIGIIGAGASGMMAAVAAHREGLRICLFEHNDKPGKKILVTLSLIHISEPTRRS